MKKNICSFSSLTISQKRVSDTIIKLFNIVVMTYLYCNRAKIYYCIREFCEQNDNRTNLYERADRVARVSSIINIFIQLCR